MLPLRSLAKKLRTRPAAGGYTAIEMVVALSIVGTVILATLGVYRLVTRAFWQVEEKSKLERILIYSMEQIMQDIRQARSVALLGPITPSANVTLLGVTYPANTPVAVMPVTTLHLDAAGTKRVDLKIPHLLNPLQTVNDATLTYFLRTMPDGSVKLYQRLTYYQGTRTEAFPVLALMDQYRRGSAMATPEPTVGVATPTPSAANTPTPIFNNKPGRMPGIYQNKDYNFDDVAFYFDSPNGILSVGLTMSLRSKSLSWLPSTQNRRRLTLTNSIALRRSQ